MSENQLLPDDPRLTAYALAELDPTEQAALEQLLFDSPEAQAAVREIRELAGLLATELRQEPAPELTAQQRAAILVAGGSASGGSVSGGTASKAVSGPVHHAANNSEAFSVMLGLPDPPAPQRSRRLDLSARRFAALATIAALIVVAAIVLPPPRPQSESMVKLTEGRDGTHILAMRSESLNRDGFAMREAEGLESGLTVFSDGAVRFDEKSDSKFGIGEAANFGRDRRAGLGMEASQKVAKREQPVRPGSQLVSGTGRGGRGFGDSGYKANAPQDGEQNERYYYGAGLKPPQGLEKQESRQAGIPKEGKPAAVKLGLSQGGVAKGIKRSPQDGEVQTGPVAAASLHGRTDMAPAKSKARGFATDRDYDSNRGLLGAQRVGERPAATTPAGGAQVLSDEYSLRKVRPDALAREVTRVVDLTDKVGPQDPDAAVGALKRTLSTLTASSDLEPKVREELRVKVQASLARNLERRDKIEKGRISSLERTLRERGATGANVGGSTGGRAGRAAGESREVAKQLAELETLAEGIAADHAEAELDKQKDLQDLTARRNLYKRLEAPGTEVYEPIVENLFFSAYEDPLSTFGVDVDTASYSNVRRFLTDQQLPPPNAVRVEELVNYFSYNYPQPAAGQPFSVNVEAANCPWTPGHQLVRIALKGKEIPRDQRPASNLVFLVDVSGSMQAENKLPLVKMGLNLLTQQMTESDQVAIVTYSDSAVKRLEATNGTNKREITQVIDSLQAAGSTNGAAGIQLAYRAALEHFIDGGTNRVILCTDGDFNVGVSDDDELVKLIQERARTKVFFSVFGFGMGNLKDGKLEKLADKGNGHYAYIDGQREAHKMFVDELVGTLVTIAKDVKLQVEFNPNQVGAYRLIGYENRVMASQDFNNDKKDAGEVGAGHTVTALYEVIPAAEAPKPQLGDSLRYRKAVVPQEGEVARELLTVKLRYKLPEADTSTLVEYPAAAAGIRHAALAGQPDASTAWYAVQLQRTDADAAAKSLRSLFGSDKAALANDKDALAIEADAANRRVLLRGPAEKILQARQALAQLGETGNSASRDFTWAAAVAAFGMILRDSQFRGQANFDMVLELAQSAQGEDNSGQRAEFIELVKKARTLYQPDAPPATPVEPVPALTREQAEAKASLNGKYKNLLRIVPAPGDATTYGSFNDNGHWEGTSYLGHDNLPPGFWVYVAPNWYIWGDK